MAETLREAAKRELAREASLEVEYVSADDADTLEEATEQSRAVLLSCAARSGATRLIDNVVLGREGQAW